ncbi:MAG: HRDC domain-containing protein [Acidobacteria bacterium]|nr:HRDC domain-containing protein [Acidobacteriota bacterium]
MPDECSYLYLTDREEARLALDRLKGETIVGLDTETYWEPSANHSKVSLVQVAPRVGDVLVVDALTVELELLRPLIESSEVSMAAHNARFDERMLAGEGLRPAAFVDTLRLARIALRLPSYSLAGVSAHLLGVELDKSYQKSNWRRRPLTRAQLNYAATDARVSLQVYDELHAILSEQGKLEQALKAAAIEYKEEEPRAPRSRRRAPQVPLRPLTDEERKTLASLKKWRLAKSFELHQPAYMICADRTLEHLAMERPMTLEALLQIYGLGASRVERFGEELLAVLHQSSG